MTAAVPLHDANGHLLAVVAARLDFVAMNASSSAAPACGRRMIHS
jgi:hypothetical protein